MKIYELSYIISPEVTSEEAENIAKELESAIQSREGTVLKQLSPVARTLSYQIQKRASGFFGVVEFQLEEDKLIELKDVIVKNKKIVRHMLIIKEAAEFKKARRTRETAKIKVSSEEQPSLTTEPKTESEVENTEKEEEVVAQHTEPKEKVELKDIEEKLEELLGE
jgi:ribosomal protein S6